MLHFIIFMSHISKSYLIMKWLQRSTSLCLLLLYHHTPPVRTEDLQQQVLAIPESETGPPLTALNFSSTSPLIFHSTFSLLHQWSNTFYPNGHTIATATIPPHTNLYHAHGNSSFPPSPEWFAFDASMAYAILGGLSDSHLLTFRTTRPVHVLYFDGTSAALTDNGSMDTQMLLLYNNSANVPDNPIWPRPPPRRPNETTPYPPPRWGYGRPPPRFNPLQGEYDRADGLCRFIRESSLGGPGWGFEGVVRMNAAFELIWCNFTSPSAQLVSWLNVSAPFLAGVAPGRYWRYMNTAFRGRGAYEWFLAAARTYGFTRGMPGMGESRVKIDSCGLFSFYDGAMEDQSRIRIKAEQARLNLTANGLWKLPAHAGDRAAALRKLTHRRRYLRATNISISDGLYMRAELEERMRETLEVKSTACSGIDWVALTQRIVTDYSTELLELRTLLAGSTPRTNASEIRSWLSDIRTLIHALYMPYYEYPSYTPSTIDQAFSTAHPSSLAALDLCKTQHNVLDLNQPLSKSENVTYTSILETLNSICSVLLPLFLSTERLWLQHFNNITRLPNLTPDLRSTISSTTLSNLQALEELMAWLGWDEQYTTCNPGCELGQVCAIPIWPVMGTGHFSGPNGEGRRPGRDGGQREGYDEYDTWLEAKCVEYGARNFEMSDMMLAEERG